MNIIPLLLKEMAEEADTTRKMLSRIPDDKYDWAPHSKSMNISRLASHIAELPGWVTTAFTTNELNFANGDYTPYLATDTKGLLAFFEKNYDQAKTTLQQAKEEELNLPWLLKNGDQILQEYTKYETVRMAFAQMIHHRAQLGVYLRLLDIPIPGSYGPSADES